MGRRTPIQSQSAIKTAGIATHKALYTMSFVLLMLALHSCKHDDTGDLKYEITGVGDVTIGSGHDTTVYWYVNKISGVSQEVRVRISNVLPSGIRIYLAKPKDDAPFDFPGAFSISAQTAPGIYPYTITASSDGQPDQSYTGNIIVVSGDCTNSVVDAFLAIESCSGSAVPGYTAIIEKVAGVQNRVKILGFRHQDSVIYADLQCKTSSLTIAPQKIAGGATVSGTGTFNTQAINISYVLTTNNGGTETCTIAMTR